ncbi:MAG: Ig-like domain-containing protein [Sulfuricaulis sp.]|nr:Ig-like domain-containing protein [Sulfuricaulis sp.]
MLMTRFRFTSFLLVLLLSPLTASAANLIGLSLAPPNPTVQVGKNIQLTTTGNYDDGTQQVIAQARQVSAGTYHTCVLNSDSTIKCWGSNSDGQLGDGTTTDAPAPVVVSGINTAVAVSAGYNHTCAVLADGTVRCWGIVGRLDNGTIISSSTPVAVSGINTAVAVNAGRSHSCAVLIDGTLRCWGFNDYGQLGNGTTTPIYSSSPVAVSGINTAVAVGVGANYTCALLADGSLRCWGRNDYSTLGNGSRVNSLSPVVVSGINTAVAVSAGGNHTCALLTDGTVRCWGVNDYGQLGDGTFADAWAPVTVSGINTVVAVSSGNSHTCAALADGTVRCWGANYNGLLGNGISGRGTDSTIPVTVSGISTAVAVSAGGEHSCAVLADGTVRCWGSNAQVQLGIGYATSYSSTPVAVGGINTAASVTTGISYTCSVLRDGTVRCWGDNFYGQLGNGTSINSSTPVIVSGINTAVAISAGSNSFKTCVLLADGTVRFWGGNFWVPTSVSGINTAVAISSSVDHTCALLADGTLRCWGANGYGQLGNGTIIDSSTPVAVNGVSPAIAVGAGYRYTCALLTDGTLRCWGANSYGQLGYGMINQGSAAPVTVSGINSVIAISTGDRHACAVLTDGTLRCWGDNSIGQLGNGTTINSSTPVTVSGISTAVAVSAGYSNTCAVLADHTVRCWGVNGVGMLGDGTTIASLTPVTVSGINTAVAVSVGSGHSCALLADGTQRCWGYNFAGQLGNGTASYFPTPTQVVNYFPLTWTSSNPAVASVDDNGKLLARYPGTAVITASVNGLSTSTTVTVTSPVTTPPTVTGLWPGTGTPGTIVFVFGSNFVPGQTQVKANTVNADLVQVLAPDLLIFVLPAGDTTGSVTVTTPTGSATSTGIFGVPPTGLSLTGFWPGTSKVGGFVFVFGSGYVVNQTQVTVNNVSASLRQVLDPNLLIFMVPPGASTGPIGVTTPNGSVSSSGMLTIAP